MMRWTSAIPAGIFIVFSAVTMLIWHGQVEHGRFLLLRHTEDVCAQAARRLEVFVESHIRMARIFARRWSTHEKRDFSRKRFDEFAAVLLDELPGFYSVGLIPPGGGAGWTVPADTRIAGIVIESAHRPVLLEARRRNRAVLSESFLDGPAGQSFFVALPLRREDEFLGTLVVEFRARTLIEDCFHARIRSEFHFLIQDEKQVLFRSSPEAVEAAFADTSPRTSRKFPVANRNWRLSMVPRPEQAAAIGWEADLSVPVFGFLLSMGLAWLTFLLLRRMRQLEAARNQHVLLSRKVILAQEEERARLSRELHDDLGQVLTAVRLEMGWLEKKLGERPGAESGALDDSISLVENATGHLRRVCRGLRPPVLDDLGLEPAARQLVEEFQERTGVEVDLDIDLDESMVPIAKETALCAYRVLQEALNNVGRHARARRVFVAARADPGGLTFEIADDGVGFDPRSEQALLGCGLEGMRERANLVRGMIEIFSAPGKGCRVFLKVPASGQPLEERR